MGVAVTLHSRIHRAARQWIRHPLVVQRHPPGIVVATCSLVLLSAIDAGMTMTLLPLGATEWNPLMRELIERDPSMFLQTKLTVTAIGVLTLVALSIVAPARRNTIECAIHTLVGFYVVLIGYEVYLLGKLT
ncbi:MAG: DUF5658 family protein [Gammaproteobacteria bacterium]